MTKKAPRLSICMPTYNRADLLAETLAHLEKACGDDVEVVVSDNHSPDHTQEVIARFAPRFRHFRSVRQPVNRGPFPNHAAAIQLGTGDYIYTLNDDDELYMEGLRAAMAVLDSDPQIVPCTGPTRNGAGRKGRFRVPSVR